MTVIEYMKDCIKQAKETVGPNAVVEIIGERKIGHLIAIRPYECGPVVGSGNTFEDALKAIK